MIRLSFHNYVDEHSAVVARRSQFPLHNSHGYKKFSSQLQEYFKKKTKFPVRTPQPKPLKACQAGLSPFPRVTIFFREAHRPARERDRLKPPRRNSRQFSANSW
jgi:hypothetical protein